MTETAHLDSAPANGVRPADSSAQARNAARVAEIDGIRGWAALSVVIFHLWLETFGKIHVEFIKPIYYFFVDGPLAVYIFFILSGDALSTPFLSKRTKRVLDKMVVKRYFRLSLPIFFVTALTIVAMWIGLTHNTEAAKLVHREDWLGRFLDFSPHVGQIITYPFFQVYSGVEYNESFSSFLWTMPIELVGSMFVFVYLYIHDSIKMPKVAILCVATFLFICTKWYALFFVGLLFSELRVSGHLEALRENKLARAAGPLLALSAYTLEYYLRATPPLADADGTISAAIRVAVQDHEKFIIATLFVSGVYLSKDLCRIFSTKLSKFLGDISFAIYLLQMVVLCTLSSLLITTYAAYLDDKSVCVAIAAVGVTATIILGYVFSIFEVSLLKRIDKGIAKLMRD